MSSLGFFYMLSLLIVHRMLTQSSGSSAIKTALNSEMAEGGRRRGVERGDLANLVPQQVQEWDRNSNVVHGARPLFLFCGGINQFNFLTARKAWVTELRRGARCITTLLTSFQIECEVGGPASTPGVQTRGHPRALHIDQVNQEFSPEIAEEAVG
ncbi:hypothetical protein B0H19DRAFT_1055555 [Mycena capillaripes]|nr:hypothetical protein B0H19DRAFT_1055555 [Mycena capillaripes]